MQPNCVTKNVVESETHKHMKRVATAVLDTLGYDASTELDDGNVRVDVHAEKDNRTIAIEVGDLGNERAEYLKEEYDELVHIPYEDIAAGRGDEIDGDMRTNVMMNEQHWGQLASVAGKQGRSKVVRELIAAYLQLSEGE